MDHVDETDIDTEELTEEVSITDDDADDTKIEKASESEEDDTFTEFNLSSYGWDSDVEGLVKRIEKGGIWVPPFQRKVVWSRPAKSRFIESLIMGLPIPSIFLSRDPVTKKHAIVDGLQRLSALKEFYAGEYYLTGKKLRPDLRGCYYSTDVAKSKSSKTLDEETTRALDDAVLHCVVIKQDVTAENDEDEGFFPEIVQLFQRLNTSGTPLQAQEIRHSIFSGPFLDLLNLLNENENWRALFGNEHSRRKDVEAILRFFAIFEQLADYKPPISIFLDDYMRDVRFSSESEIGTKQKLFTDTVALVVESLGDRAFKSQSGAFLLSRYDAVMYGLARLIAEGVECNLASVRKGLGQLLGNKEYQWAVEEFVNDNDRMTKRTNLAYEIFRQHHA